MASSDETTRYKLHISFGLHWKRMPLLRYGALDFDVAASYIDLTPEEPTIRRRVIPDHDQEAFLAAGPDIVGVIFSLCRMAYPPEQAIQSFAPVLSRFSRILAGGERAGYSLRMIELILFRVTSQQLEAVDPAVLEFYFPTRNEDVSAATAQEMPSRGNRSPAEAISSSPAHVLRDCLEWLRTCPAVYQLEPNADPGAMMAIASTTARDEIDVLKAYLLLRRFNARLRSLEIVVKTDDDQCSICLDDYFTETSRDDHGDRAVVRTMCSHAFHRRCIIEWLNRRFSCPLCRHPLLPP